MVGRSLLLQSEINMNVLARNGIQYVCLRSDKSKALEKVFLVSKNKID